MDAFEQLIQADNDTRLLQLRDMFFQEGYPTFRRFLDRFYAFLKGFRDDQAEETLALIEKARRAMPTPGDLSPSWANIWDHLAEMTRYKARVLRSVPPIEREGEWQILIDNPFMNREVACYPGLKFEDAAYIYAKFRPDLEHHEYIRMQKIQTHITEFGERK